MSNSVDRQRSVRDILLISVFMGAIGFLVIAYTCLFSRNCYLSYDSVITEMGICLESSTYQPVIEVPSGAEQFYLCGKIEGTTPRPGRLHVFLSGKTSSIYSAHFEEPPGTFYYELTGRSALRAGRYRVQIGYARETLASIEFVID